MVDIVIHNGIIITVNSNFDIIQNGSIYVKNGLIDGIESNSENHPDSKEKIDAQGCVVIPGLINTHSHLPMSLFRGLADDLPLHQWLNDYIFPAEATYITPETVYFGTLLSCAEMILSGTTTCCDGYFLEHEVANAVNKIGMRSVLGQGVIDFPAPGVQNPEQNITIAQEFIDKCSSISPLISCSIFCHSPYTCSSKTLQKAKQVTRDKNLLFQIHIAETKQEWQQCIREHQVSPIKYLDQLGILDNRTLLVHAIWINDEDIEIIQKKGCGVSIATESGMKLGSGIAPLTQLVATQIPVGLGTDSCASNNNLDMFREMDMTAKLHKVHTLNPTVIDSKIVLYLATMGGARAIGLNHQIGSLEVGKQADIVIIDMKKPHLTPLYHPESHLVYASSGADVRDVVIAGKIVVRNQKLLTIPLADILNWFSRGFKITTKSAQSFRHASH